MTPEALQRATPRPTLDLLGDEQGRSLFEAAILAHFRHEGALKVGPRVVVYCEPHPSTGRRFVVYVDEEGIFPHTDLWEALFDAYQRSDAFGAQAKCGFAPVVDPVIR